MRGGYLGTRPFGVPGRSCGCCSWRRWCSGRRRARPPARLGDRAALGAASRSLPVPSGPSGALHASVAWPLTCGRVRRLDVRPGPATAHGHCSLALRSLRCPPRRRPLVSRSPAGPAAAHRHRGCALRSLRRPPHLRCCGASHWSCRHAPAPRPDSPDPPVLSTPATPGVRLCRLTSRLSRMRYKVRLALVVGGESGTKFSLHAQNSPKRAILSEQGEFCAESGAVWLVRGELFRVHRHCNQASKSSISTEARPFCASLPAIPAKPVAYADRLLRYG